MRNRIPPETPNAARSQRIAHRRRSQTLLCLAIPLLLVANERSYGAVHSDEEIIFFDTFGYRSEDRSVWKIPIHGWIFEPEKDSKVRGKIFEDLRKALNVDEDAARSAIFNKRARPFVVDSERGKRIQIRIGSSVYKLDASKPNGHFTETLKIPAEAVERLRRARQGQGDVLAFRAVTQPEDSRVFSGTVHLLGGTGVSVISDVDDTIRDCQSRDRLVFLHNTLLAEYRPVPGMAAIYRAWAKDGASFHYVSAGPWQFYPPIRQLLTDHRYPTGSIHLQFFRWKDSSFFEMFESSDVKKRPVIESILKAAARRKFILVGDSAEKDPEVYGDVARAHPDRIVKILIRNVTNEPAGSPRFQEAFRGLPKDRWTVFQTSRQIESFKIGSP